MNTKKKSDVNIWQLLRSVDTPTVCNAIEVVKGKRQLENFSKVRGVVCVNPSYEPVVGFALTASISAAKEITYDRDVLLLRKSYYQYMAEKGRAIPEDLQHLTTHELPYVNVVEDRDGPEAIGAFWGEVNAAIHWGMGLAGTITNGLMRDLDVLQEGYQIIAGGVGPSHGFVHVRDVGKPIQVFGIDVAPHDILHADRHGAVKIEPEVFVELPQAIADVVAKEQPIIAAAKKQNFDLQELLKAMGLNDL